MIMTACANVSRSDHQPMSVGEIASPKRWMAKIESAMAAARSTGGTSETIAALMGPVEANTSSSHAMSTGQNVPILGVASAHHASGAAASVVMPETHRLA